MKIKEIPRRWIVATISALIIPAIVWAVPTYYQIKLNGVGGSITSLGFANKAKSELNGDVTVGYPGTTSSVWSLNSRSTTTPIIGIGTANTEQVRLGRTGKFTTVLGKLNVDEATTLDTTLGVTGNTLLSGTLGVTGLSTATGGVATNAVDAITAVPLVIGATTASTIQIGATNATVQLGGTTFGALTMNSTAIASNKPTNWKTVGTVESYTGNNALSIGKVSILNGASPADCVAATLPNPAAVGDQIWICNAKAAAVTITATTADTIVTTGKGITDPADAIVTQGIIGECYYFICIVYSATPANSRWLCIPFFGTIGSVTDA